VRVAVTYCTPNYFTLLGVRTELGRYFRETRIVLVAAIPSSFLAMLSGNGNFSGAPDILGRTIHLNERAFTVIE